MGAQTIGLLVDPEVLVANTLRFHSDEPDSFILRGFREMGVKASVKPFLGLHDLSEWIRREKPEIVVNLTEHVCGDRSRDAHVAALLDLLGVVYTGPGPRGLILCRDKAHSKLIAQREGFDIPQFFPLDDKGGQFPDNIKFPAVLKPRFEDSSTGITQSSLVRNRKALKSKAEELFRIGIRNLICEEYIDGRELLVCFAGSRVMPIRELIWRNRDRKYILASHSIKFDKRYRRRVLRQVGDALLTRRQQSEIADLTLRTARSLELHDFGRLDVRLTPMGKWVFLEANPNPPIVPPKFTWYTVWTGTEHQDILKEIVLSSLRRNGKQTAAQRWKRLIG